MVWVIVFGVILVYVALHFIFDKESHRSAVIFGLVLLGAGLIAVITGGYSYQKDRLEMDRALRTTIVTGVVVMSDTYGAWKGKKPSCLQAFELNNTQYTFEFCGNPLNNPSYSPPKVGDVVLVRFIRPQNPEWKLVEKVLEMHNYTQELERLRSIEEEMRGNSTDSSLP